jgi:lysophospholipase L1-like esterase
MLPAVHTWRSFVAVGDSFTEGMVDDVGDDGRYIGWADRVAWHLAERQPNFQYANLAIRGKLIGEMVQEQVPIACEMRPDLVTFGGGINDAMRRHFDLPTLATQVNRSIRDLRATGADVVVFAFGDPSRRSSVMGTLRDRLRGLNAATRDIARAYGAKVVDFWGVSAFDSDEMWDEDRLHLSPQGHRLVASAVLESLGLGDDNWRTPSPWIRPNPLRQSTAHLQWARQHGLPWVARRMRGASSGAGIVAKRPELSPMKNLPQPE